VRLRHEVDVEQHGCAGDAEQAVARRQVAVGRHEAMTVAMSPATPRASRLVTISQWVS
jgi:hypothetical protein